MTDPALDSLTDDDHRHLYICNQLAGLVASDAANPMAPHRPELVDNILAAAAGLVGPYDGALVTTLATTKNTEYIDALVAWDALEVAEPGAVDPDLGDEPYQFAQMRSAYEALRDAYAAVALDPSLPTP